MKESLVPDDVIINKIYLIRDQKVMLDKDLLLKMEKLENQVTENSESIKLIFTALKKLLNSDKIERKQIGYKLEK